MDLDFYKKLSSEISNAINDDIRNSGLVVPERERIFSINHEGDELIKVDRVLKDFTSIKDGKLK